MCDLVYLVPAGDDVVALAVFALVGVVAVAEEGGEVYPGGRLLQHARARLVVGVPPWAVALCASC